MQSFNIDFNWVNGSYASPDSFSQADPRALAQWYKELGCDNFWTFAVSYNGYAWYDSKLSPKVNGLEGNFTKACVEEGHKLGVSVFAYHCLAAANPTTCMPFHKTDEIGENWPPELAEVNAKNIERIKTMFL